MSEPRQCDGRTFFGLTVEKCDKPATHHVYVDEREQYDFCDRHYYFDQHGHYPEDKPDGERDEVQRD
jgi:hypothetical protein